MWHRPPLASILGTAVLLASPVLGAQQVGRAFEFAVDTPHPYARSTGPDPSFQARIEHPGATYVSIHFDRFDLARGDQVIVRSGDGRQRYAYTGRGKAGLGAFWATRIDGDIAVVELLSGSGHRGWGFSIDRYAAGLVDLDAAAPPPETVCGTDDRRNAACYEAAYPDAYDHVRPVARLLVEGTLLCTGFLVGCEGHLLTNDHCIDDPRLSDPSTAVVNTDYEFAAEAPDCGSTNDSLAWPGEIWPGAASLVHASATLDYALILLQGDPAATYGSLLLDDRTPILGEPIYVPQHGGGFARQIALESSDPNDVDGFCHVFRNNELSCTGGPGEVGYFCDTDGGSSGAPVIASGGHRVIALHHCGGCPGARNTGVAIFRIIDDLGPLLPASAVASPSCGNGTLECGELCDGAQLGGETCASQGFTSGSLGCSSLCTGFGTGGCSSTCGDAQISPDETCEGGNLNGQDCLSLGYTGGTLACDVSCMAYDTDACTSSCGDGLVSPDESCDGSNLGGESCSTLGFDSGTLSCTAGCGGFDPSACCGPIEVAVECITSDSGGISTCDGADRLILRLDKPSPAGVGIDLYQIDEGDFYPGSIGPVTCHGTDLESATAPGTPLILPPPIFNPGPGEIAYYLVSCHQCGGPIVSGVSRYSDGDTERILAPACSACP